jgi:hypothetical protein
VGLAGSGGHGRVPRGQPLRQRTRRGCSGLHSPRATDLGRPPEGKARAVRWEVQFAAHGSSTRGGVGRKCSGVRAAHGSEARSNTLSALRSKDGFASLAVAECEVAALRQTHRAERNGRGCADAVQKGGRSKCVPGT